MANQERSTGTVLWFNNMKGYGFIKPSDGGEDLFVHQSSIISDGFRSLAEGEEVEFSIVTESDGKSSAIEVTGIDGSSLKGASREGFGRGWKGGDRYSGGGGGDGCYICGEVGHLARDCNRGKNTAGGGGGGSGACFNCGGIGHMARDCNRASGNGRAGGGGGGSGACFNCGGFGHMARDCNNRGSTGGGSGAGGGACYNCGGFGHLARDCTSRGGGGSGAKFGGSGKCFNCGEMGHFARECTKTS